MASARKPLDEYRAKRNFDKTPEPAPKSLQNESSQRGGQRGKKKELEFVVQKHDATRLHYDVRLEIEGAMMSFAVPKGPSYDPDVKRLAVETEDHPMEYNRFEGRIPDGEYGAGDVLIWDRGTYETVPAGQEVAMRAKGHIHARFFGEKLEGGWHFVKTKRHDDDAPPKKANIGKSGQEKVKAQWLMFKAHDETADKTRDILTESPGSVVSGRSATRGPRRVGASTAGKNAEALLTSMGEVAKASVAETIATPSDYWFEIKYDGYRILIGKAGNEIRLRSRNQKDWTGSFQSLADAARRLNARETVIDGEACAVDDAGRPSFQALQGLLAGERKAGVHLAYAAFDLLWLDGRDLRALPIEERRELLEALMGDAPPPLSYSRALPGADYDALVALAKSSNLEGLVAKKKRSPYAPGSAAQWIKIKFDRRQDCAIVGYVPLARMKSDVGALLLGVVENGKMRYAGRVGTGFDTRTRRALAKRLDAIRIAKPAIVVPASPGAIWTEVKLACEVAFGEWTDEGSMRRPSFIGMREDKDPEDCLLDTAGDTVVARTPREKTGAKPGKKSRIVLADAAPLVKPNNRVKLTNPDKVLYPRDGITKQDILAYYTNIAPFMLPHLAGRPLTMQRWPNGIDGEAWYQQNAPEKAPEFVRLLTFERKTRIVVENVDTLAWLANLAALTLHQWASHAPALDKPDYVVLDLDPGDGTWAHLIEVATAVRALLDALEMESAVKTSGKRGIHIVVPIAHGPSHEEATAFGEKAASAIAKVLPKIATVERMKEKRHGRLYVDYLQNGEGRTIVAPYTLRALDGAPVSTPIAWSEVTTKLDPRAFTLRTVPDRVAKFGDLFAPALHGTARLPRI